MPTRQPQTRPSPTAGNNRDQILAAAREEFAAKGFQSATMRSIATRAGFDVALLAHYFSNKDGLFTAAMTLPLGALDALQLALNGDPDQQGERLARGYLSLWEEVGTGAQMKALARSALINEAASTMARTVLMGTVSRPDVAPLLENRLVGLALAMTHLAGIATGRYLSKIPYLANLDFDDLIALVTPATQRYLSDVRDEDWL